MQKPISEFKLDIDHFSVGSPIAFFEQPSGGGLEIDRDAFYFEG